MQIERDLSAYQLVPVRFARVAVGAGLTDQQLNAAEVAGPAALEVTSVTVPFAGEVVGISYDLSAAASVGSLTVRPSVDGTGKTDPGLSITTGVTGSDTCNRGKVPFAKGARLGCQVTSSGDWNGAGDLQVLLWVVLRVEGI
jgi:hypothetical protein